MKVWVARYYERYEAGFASTTAYTSLQSAVDHVEEDLSLTANHLAVECINWNDEHTEAAAYLIDTDTRQRTQGFVDFEELTVSE